VYRYLFGPVPSRRLGYSLGVDLVTAKTCSFDCVFCQIGKTDRLTLERREYVPVAGVVREISAWLDTGASADCITLSGSGEPTLHSSFGGVLEAIHGKSPIKTAILSNGSLFYLPEVRSGAALADIVKVSLSAWDQTSFERINRPYSSLNFQSVVEGLQIFGSEFKGELWLEVFVVSGVNDDEKSLKLIAALAGKIGPDRIQLNTVVRPPVESSARAVPAQVLEKFACLFQPVAEVIVPFSACEASAINGNDKDVAGLLARHPCVLGDVATLFGNDSKKAEAVLEKMVAQGRIRVEKHGAESFYTAVDVADSYR